MIYLLGIYPKAVIRDVAKVFVCLFVLVIGLFLGLGLLLCFCCCFSFVFVLLCWESNCKWSTTALYQPPKFYIQEESLKAV